ncbi:MULTISPECIES: glycine cleavage system aminomethyltransferase GcvT [Heyndrickxia]|uniref:glycine cleavage system aminomethyltransferase GcvT n=1 Tax=Heyndrickxia TaxID=2837504 RepID=UPI00055521B4|nr:MULTISPECIES: glycine cleavage system aminomethyltransferase GcvT [Heyndrickxia]KGT40143.1 glycine cleavage system protein T [Heyndrickxia coagulans P38]KYC64117.1 Aminomethyltransferase (glycine cleavage system T protein) [Heyndrickxia coagulans]KYC91683.1 Aminomethyltransferase (glycine cleavage system T protein) [Heyndrickxia coagulans]MED4321768.1 glycine cleavage system aminomethyltransferase GcvT [Weizmannia sp. CD-2023]
MPELKRTPLYDVYRKYGAKTTGFGGWELPVQFSGIKAEHEAVRTRAGLFDVSHMGEILVEGPESLGFLQKMMTNDVSKLKPGAAQYTAMCNEAGGTVDDLLVYQLGENRYWLVVNAANTEKDYKWLVSHRTEDVSITDISVNVAQLALQGPLAAEVMQKLAPEADVFTIPSFSFIENANVAGCKVLLSRTGYTGEDGFEIYCRSEDAPKLWDEILAKGREKGVLPCGLGSRDTLRFEAGLCLYGQELAEDISPLEAGIGFAVKLKKEADFIGKQALLAQKAEGLKRRLAGIEMTGRGIPRHGYSVYAGDERIGMVTTGTQSPTLKKNIGLALLRVPWDAPGTEVEVDVRSKKIKAVVVQTPFYKKQKNGEGEK